MRFFNIVIIVLQLFLMNSIFTMNEVPSNTSNWWSTPRSIIDRSHQGAMVTRGYIVDVANTTSDYAGWSAQNFAQFRQWHYDLSQKVNTLWWWHDFVNRNIASWSTMTGTMLAGG